METKTRDFALFEPDGSIVKATLPDADPPPILMPERTRKRLERFLAPMVPSKEEIAIMVGLGWHPGYDVVRQQQQDAIADAWFTLDARTMEPILPDMPPEKAAKMRTAMREVWDLFIRPRGMCR